MENMVEIDLEAERRSWKATQRSSLEISCSDFGAGGTPSEHIGKEITGHAVAGYGHLDAYDVNAKAALDGTISGDRLMPLIQALLVERFYLRIHRETRELPIYSLVVGKSGPKLEATTAAAGSTWSRTPGLLTGQKISMEMFATDLLEAQLDRVVTDHTGIKGEFDVRLTWTPIEIDIRTDRADIPVSAIPDGPSLFTAIQEQLGLKLEPARGQSKSLSLKARRSPLRIDRRRPDIGRDSRRLESAPPLPHATLRLRYNAIGPLSVLIFLRARFFLGRDQDG